MSFSTFGKNRTSPIIRAAGGRRYVLRLYVTGLTPRSLRAAASVRAVCETHLHGRYDLGIIDIYQRPDLAKSAQVIATPTLVRYTPHPIRRLIGDMTSEAQLLHGLDLDPASPPRVPSRMRSTTPSHQ